MGKAAGFPVLRDKFGVSLWEESRAVYWQSLVEAKKKEAMQN